jgi:UDPglucose 6-dehydrogenase
MPPVKAKIGGRVAYAGSPMEAAQGADALLIATEWSQYKAADLDALAKAMKAKVLFDGRNLFRPEAMAKAGWTYHSIGRLSVS